MRNGLLFCILLSARFGCATPADQWRSEAEYYVTQYAQHYRVPLEFVRAVVAQESAWQRCPVSPNGAMGLMQLMPETAKGLNVQNRCDLKQNVSGGVRYMAWLMWKFKGDLRLVAAAYYAGEHAIERRGLKFRNPQVVKYVADIRRRVEQQRAAQRTCLDVSRRTP